MVPERRLQEPPAETTVRRPVQHVDPHLKVFLLRWALTISVGIFVVSRFAAAAQAGYALDQLQSQLAVAQAQEVSLRGAVAQISSAGRLVTIAPRLHLNPSPAVMAVTVPPVTDGGAAAPATAKARRSSGLFAALGALIQAIAAGVARM